MTHALRHLARCAILPALLRACGGPVGPLAGGRLCGPVVTDPVEDWSFTAARAALRARRAGATEAAAMVVRVVAVPQENPAPTKSQSGRHASE